MKFLIVFSVIAAVASAGVIQPALVPAAVSEIQEVLAAINSPSTDPATAAALEQMLYETLGISTVQEPAPISVGPAIIDFPLPDGGAVTAEETAVAESPALVPAPVIDATPAGVDAAAPLVQIILNINQVSDVGASPVAPAPVETPVVAADPVLVVEDAVNAETVVPGPVSVVDVAPVNVVEAAPEPIQVVEVEPVQIGTPVMPEPIVIPEPIIIPAPVVILPETLN